MPPIDYAVQRCCRMDDSRQMDKLLDSGKVTTEQMEQLAAVLAPFHRQVVPRSSETPRRYHLGRL
ncbi:MAG: hypothetical protein IPM98_22640 [Lewinellaceae bacterium]|nr:hypothetical protein [Lewinellaceae bacterium]